MLRVAGTRKNAMPKEVICTYCDRIGHYQTFCPFKTVHSLKPYKPISRIGRRGTRYMKFRNEVAYPSLVERDGELCAICKRPGVPLDVDHIKKRSTHPELKYDLDNLQLLCRDCHTRKDV